MIDFFVANWDTIGLIFTNIAALFIQSPIKRS